LEQTFLVIWHFGAFNLKKATLNVLVAVDGVGEVGAVAATAFLVEWVPATPRHKLLHNLIRCFCDVCMAF
jgi:hypothetical protein